MDYLDKLKEKCNLDNNFMDIIASLFEKLENFGYISKKKQKVLEKKLYQNIDVVIFGNSNIIDYKTGYYDAIKKELYIKDAKDVKSIYLRMIYILTTQEISDDTFAIGYSTSTLSKPDYKILHKNFAINRAIVSNLVCRLLYTLPTTLSIVPTYRTYENDFLGNKIKSDNDIYFLEGKLFSQLCYCLNTSEEEFYINLFESPNKFIYKYFTKNKFKEHIEFLSVFDSLSRKYSNYNKLIHLNKLLNDNYLNIKRNILKDVSNLQSEQKKINKMILTTLIKMNPKDDNTNDELDINIEASLAETINNLEEDVINNITQIQNMFVNLLITSEDKYSIIDYAIHLKELSKLLILPNEDLNKKIFDVISSDILKYNEHISTNLIEKLKYSIVNEIFSSDKYIKIYKNMGIQKLNQIKTDDDASIVALNVDGSFMQLVKVNSLDNQMSTLNNNTFPIRLDSMGYILNTPTQIKDVSKVEKIFTQIRHKFSEFNNVRIEKMYIGNIDNNTFVVIENDDKFSIIEVNFENDNISCKLVNMSQNYKLFNTSSNLPVLYNKEKSPIKKVLSLLFSF